MPSSSARLKKHEVGSSLSLADQLAAIATMSSADLKMAWQGQTGTPLPRVSPKLLRMALAWEVQAAIQGGLSRATQATLTQIAGGKTRTIPAAPGTRLLREWQGRMHVVTIGGDNVIHWEDRQYRSLSQVAHAITGTKWSGPAFFGLRKKAA